MQIQYEGDSLWKLTFDSGTVVLLKTEEIEALIEQAPEALYYQCKTTNLKEER